MNIQLTAVQNRDERCFYFKVITRSSKQYGIQ